MPYRLNWKMQASALAATALVSLTGAGLVEAAERLRISLDTNPSHVRNEGVELFVEALRERVGDEMVIEVYPSAQLYRDRDVGRALRQGSVEMAVPGTWVLDGMVPAMALTSLPAFYGVPQEVTLDLIDGELGEAINAQAEERMRVKVLGPWMSLGMSHYYSTSRPLNSHDDLAGMRIRISGGTSNAKRVEDMGGVPNLIAWPDVPLALSTDVVDAVSSTHESIASAQLWDAGLRFAFEDNQWFGQYVPMVSQRFWDDLSPHLQEAMTQAWAEVIEETRRLADEAQLEARAKVAASGIAIVTATEEQLAAARTKLMSSQDGLASSIGIDQDLVDMALEELEERGYGD